MVSWYLMRIQLSQDTINSLEDLSGKKISRNGDTVIQEVCDIASQNCEQKGKAWLEPDSSEKEEKDESS